VSERIVLDTNVWVSALLSSKGAPATILRAARAGMVRLLASDYTADELLRVLNYPKIRRYPHVTDDLVRGVAALLVNEVERVEIDVRSTLSPDPDDNMFLDVALSGKATALVTGDKSHLLSLREIEGIPILKARDFVSSRDLERKLG
jgi:putative PIN family toxin of toxin-antitoxin system